MLDRTVGSIREKCQNQAKFTGFGRIDTISESSRKEKCHDKKFTGFGPKSSDKPNPMIKVRGDCEQKGVPEIEMFRSSGITSGIHGNM